MPLLFSDENINIKALRQRAFNLRWATLPEDVIPLTAADPDFECASEIVEAIKSYANEKVFSYGPPEGLPSFKQEIARTMQERRGLLTSPDLVLPVDGAARGMAITAAWALQPGDEAIIFDPVDFLFKTSIQAAGGIPVRLPLDVKTGDYDVDRLKALITPKTKLLCICNPHNPTGKVFTRDELTVLGNIAVENNLYIMSDEIWSDIVFPPHTYTSIASISPEIAARTVTIYGFSKTFGLAALRAGFIISPDTSIHKEITEISMVNTTIGGISTISQIAAQTAFEKCWYWADDFLKHLTAMRDLTVERLNMMKGISCSSPQGCYVAFANITSTGLTSEEVAAYLIKKAKVAVVPGAERWFGPGAEGHIRLCFSTSHTILKEALDRIENAIGHL